MVTTDAGVYAIRHKPTGTVYIGSSLCLRRRWQSHQSRLHSGVHPNSRLQRDWLRDGPTAFEFAVLTTVPWGDRELETAEANILRAIQQEGSVPTYNPRPVRRSRAPVRALLRDLCGPDLGELAFDLLEDGHL